MLRIIKLRIIVPPLVVIFPADFLGRELVRLLLPSTEHFQQFGGIQFADEMMDKPVSFYAFEMLYWCGIREGELLALTAADFSFDKETATINKSYQRLHGEDVITSPKTKKSNRTIKMPKFLCEEMQESIGMLYGKKRKTVSLR